MTSHPYDGVKFAGCDLFSPLHGSSHLLLVLLREKGYHLSTDGVETLGYLRLWEEREREREREGERGGWEGGRDGREGGMGGREEEREGEREGGEWLNVAVP